MVCPICGRQYSAPPAISRVDNETPICPVCGARQGFENAGMGGKLVEQIMKEIEEKEIESGRVEKRVEALV